MMFLSVYSDAKRTGDGLSVSLWLVTLLAMAGCVRAAPGWVTGNASSASHHAHDCDDSPSEYRGFDCSFNHHVETRCKYYAQAIKFMDRSESERYGGIPLVSRNASTMPGSLGDCDKPSCTPLNTTQYLPVPCFCECNTTLIQQQFHYFVAFNPTWCQDFTYTMQATHATGLIYEVTHPPTLISKMSYYTTVYEFFRDNYGIGMSQAKRPPGLWTPDNATDPLLPQDNHWNDDNVFGQLRLMGVNPLQLQRVTYNWSVGVHYQQLQAMLNTTLDLAVAIKMALGRDDLTVPKAILEERLYVLHFPLLKDIRGDPEAKGAYANRLMMAPVALFVATENPAYPLKPIAIQLGHTQASPIHTPDSGYFWWTVSKMYVNNADGLTSQIRHHLVNSHLISEVFAVEAFIRLPFYHPIYILLQQHFEGLVGINSKGFELLTSKCGSVTKVAGFGFSGLGDFIKSSYENWTWDDTEMLGGLERRGVETSVLKQYPFRDDGLKVYSVLRKFVKAYVTRFYCSDKAVYEDRNLQKWIQKVSKRHENKGVPSSFSGRADLVDLLIRVIWVNSAQHAALNYPVKEIGSFIPATAYTVFKRPEQWSDTEIASITSNDHNDGLVAMLPQYQMAIEQTGVATQLASLRYTDLLTYADKLRGPAHLRAEAGKIVRKYRKKLMAVDANLRQINIDRRRAGLMPYRNMLPTFLPNSIAI
ncbi:polyunsaturated fatty acid 5-lipoxygenase-like [Sycon ciliatum]|uniref:polyunsaturated fatty acid 5-lipoxygenase-like n=1 Tax=Sycon ciliatum TaxID=27933 RepID=UPI0031F7179F